MTHQCRMCGALTFDNKPHGPLRCADCGNVGAGTINTFDEEPDRDDRDPDEEERGEDDAEDA